MSTNFVDISSKIKSLLQTITGLNAVYEYVPASPDDGKFPFASIRLSASEAEFADNQRNMRIYKFIIDVFIERTTAAFGNEKSERIMRELCDAIVTLFDNKTTLDGMVQYVTPVGIEFDFKSAEIGDVRAARINIEAHKVVTSVN